MSYIEPVLLEKEAHSFLSENNCEEAFRLFKKAAEAHRDRGDYKQAALCFASAASCWSRKSEEKTFYNAALAYENAARSAEKSGDFEYASLLYKHAAINYERDGEYKNYSDCFYLSKESQRRFLCYRLLSPGKITPITESSETDGVRGFWKRLFAWFFLTFSFLVWGHGERPARAFLSVVSIIFLSAVFYAAVGQVSSRGSLPFNPGFADAFYLSVVTFTTVGYGDITPLGLSRIVALFEAFSGIFLMPLFVIALARKYLRI